MDHGTDDLHQRRIGGTLMLKLLIAIGIGAAAGVVDVAPMVLRHVDRATVLSAFTHWVVVGVLAAYVNLPLPPWMVGALVALLTALPELIQRLGQHPPRIAGVLAMSLLLGAGVGLATARFAG
jgi:hypothetical protein